MVFEASLVEGKGRKGLNEAVEPRLPVPLSLLRVAATGTRNLCDLCFRVRSNSHLLS